jgi:hypothetical protein
MMACVARPMMIQECQTLWNPSCGEVESLEINKYITTTLGNIKSLCFLSLDVNMCSSVIAAAVSKVLIWLEGGE